jgi:ATP-dependent DNA helicase RecG
VKLSLQSSLIDLNKGKTTKSIDKLIQTGIKNVEDLLWILPLSVLELPKLNSFQHAKTSQLFLGYGKILHIDSRPGKSYGRGNIPLLNITATVQDCFSDKTISLKWFNAYPSIIKKVNSFTKLEFEGLISQFQGQLQIVNPIIRERIITESGEYLLDNNNNNKKYKVKYPTINTVGSAQISNIISKIPHDFWDAVPDTIQEKIHQKRQLIKLNEAFKILHGKMEHVKIEQSHVQSAKRRLIYEEFLREQLKISLRKNKEHNQEAIKVSISDIDYNHILNLFPYELTIDQKNVCHDIRNNFLSGSPMMRLIQGDVGCGKTSVALVASMIALKNKLQVALMCPTESLALQHYLTLNPLMESNGYLCTFLVGSTKKKEKEEIYLKLLLGEIDFIIGTHSLIQDKVQFKNLALSIIDEQHKFGVNQRLKLSNKKKGSHTLIMTATPIPRSLSLTQYGDLDISIIRTMPSGRRGTQTKIITEENFQQFLNFLSTRLSMSEQAYVVVPAIVDNPESDLVNLELVLEKFKTLFPNYKMKGIHGQLKGPEKQQIFREFSNHEFDLLISTSVIEVGINVLNSTVMAIMNPDRFGLSSLHQLRGRVGRGEKPGFCFLVNDKNISQSSMKRLKVIEKNTDGFIISEEDLKVRGEGNLFGTEQSGVNQFRKVANIIDHCDILLVVKEDFNEIASADNPLYQPYIDYLSQDERIFTTI